MNHENEPVTNQDEAFPITQDGGITENEIITHTHIPPVCEENPPLPPSVLLENEDGDTQPIETDVKPSSEVSGENCEDKTSLPSPH